MKQKIGSEYSGDALILFLRDNCDATEEISYTKRFSSDQLAQKKEELANVSIELAELEDQKKEALEEFKFNEKPKKALKSILLADIKNKAESVNEQCFKFIDTESRTVGFYNQDGELVSSRPAFGNELQGSIFQMNRAAI